jgi:ribosomal-protein-alanine N-acetyltransferase
MIDVKIEPLNTSHIGPILEIEKTHFPTPWTRTMFEQELQKDPRGEGPGSHAVVAMHGGRLVGYAVAWFVDDGVHLLNIAVSKEFQRNGVGRVLLEDLIERAIAAKKLVIILEVRAGNAAAQEFYARFMFTNFGVRRGYYADTNEDAILMGLDLSELSDGRQRGREKPIAE